MALPKNLEKFIRAEMKPPIGTKAHPFIDPHRSKRFTYLVLFLNALFWSVILNGLLAMFGRGTNEEALAAMFVFGPLFLLALTFSIVSYFFLERLLKLKRSTLLFLPLIVLSFPMIWIASTWAYGSLKQTMSKGLPTQTLEQETFKLDVTYRNDQYGFEFRYPQSWIAGSHNPNVEDPLSLSISAPDYEADERYFGYDIPAVTIKRGASLGVLVEENPVGYSDDIVVEFNQRYPNYRDHYLDKEISVSGQKAIVRTDNTSRNTNLTFYVKLPYDIDG